MSHGLEHLELSDLERILQDEHEGWEDLLLNDKIGVGFKSQLAGDYETYRNAKSQATKSEVVEKLRREYEERGAQIDAVYHAGLGTSPSTSARADHLEQILRWDY